MGNGILYKCGVIYIFKNINNFYQINNGWVISMDEEKDLNS